MKPGLLAVVLSFVGIGAVVYAFMTNASPYVTVAQAQVSQADNLHVAGEIVPGTLDVSATSQTVRFIVKDDEGKTLPVLYKGAPPANMASATRVVVIGGMKEGVFTSEKMLLKCPSKYESSDTPMAKSEAKAS
ncbi:MAG: cytochrome c maturation protein CcmE [Fimbriimonadaceae bacterium]|nr:cytochrome c maturation protein CcmE [Fimbriimonadaceae bacterium]QYK57118.1 MAG: cytochrome c maturation protein CcmE [Fimbriimonadaceae bacterium]